jgi:flagellar hook-basal body complex protein FliE
MQERKLPRHPSNNQLGDMTMAKAELVEAEFSYEDIDKDDAALLRHCEKELQKHKASVAVGLMAIGETLTIAHERLAKYGQGSFQKWIESKCGFSKRSAYNYMAAFNVFGDCATVAQMEDGAMYALASKGTPENALKEVLKLAAKGTNITQKHAKEIIKKHKQVEPAPSGGGSANGSAVTPRPVKPQPPQPSKEDQAKSERKKARSYAEYLQRSIDDLNRLQRNTGMHAELIKACGQILRGLEQW